MKTNGSAEEQEDLFAVCYSVKRIDEQTVLDKRMGNSDVSSVI